MSKIEWTDVTWNPIRARNLLTGKVGWHCEHVSPGCVNCYSERQNKAGARGGTRLPFKPGHRADIELFLDEETLLEPLRWKKPRVVFVCSMTDLFADFVTDAWIDRVFAVMALAPQHTFIVLTKRAKRMREYVTSRAALDESGQPAEDVRVVMTALVATPSRREMAPALKAIPLGKFCAQGPWPLPNVYLGVSAERQQEADERIPELLATPATWRFVSAEPLLGPIDFTSLTVAVRGNPPYGYDALRGRTAPFMTNQPEGYWSGKDPRLDGVILGGESGPGARPMHPDWASSVRDQCAAAGVPFFFKQWGEFREFDTGPPPHITVDNDSASADVYYAIAINPSFVAADGRHFARVGLPPDIPARLIERVGRARAGRRLDGVEHNALPWTLAK